MSWYAVYHIDTGALRGAGSQVPPDDDLADRGLAKKTEGPYKGVRIAPDSEPHSLDLG